MCGAWESTRESALRKNRFATVLKLVHNPQPPASGIRDLDSPGT